METKIYKAAGRYFKQTHPEGFASWAKDERSEGRPTTLEAAGAYIEECDPEMFDMIQGRN
jgi:hypothetical protein